MITEKDVPAEALQKLLKLQDCTETNVPDVEASISIFCSLDGIRQFAENIVATGGDDQASLLETLKANIRERIAK